MMTNLDRIRKQLNKIIAEAAADIEAREQALAGAMEMATTDCQVRAAFEQGMQYKEDQVLALIDQQLSTLQRSGHNAISLQTLKRAIKDG